MTQYVIFVIAAAMRTSILVLSLICLGLSNLLSAAPLTALDQLKVLDAQITEKVKHSTGKAIGFGCGAAGTTLLFPIFPIGSLAAYAIADINKVYPQASHYCALAQSYRLERKKIRAAIQFLKEIEDANENRLVNGHINTKNYTKDFRKNLLEIMGSHDSFEDIISFIHDENRNGMESVMNKAISIGANNHSAPVYPNYTAEIKAYIRDRRPISPLYSPVHMPMPKPALETTGVVSVERNVGSSSTDARIDPPTYEKL